YDPSYSSRKKIWCKKISEDSCQPLVPSNSTGAGKLTFSIQHSPQFNVFTVTMTKLKMSDSGIYHCGIIEYYEIIVLRTIRLVVSRGHSRTPTTGTFPTWRAHTFNTTEDPISIPARGRSVKGLVTGVAFSHWLESSRNSEGPVYSRGSISSVIVPVVCGLLSKTLVFTVLFIVTQKSFRRQTMKAHNSDL
ncbi:triggering receptor expressed on myeloid cells 1-like, partial [Mastomys coucha]|uniref:triggering receptor expressed on myeloid cells 1-like n=1 Tax=Mastomys coucha TaxID=35658 RepID=UPI0012625601